MEQVGSNPNFLAVALTVSAKDIGLADQVAQLLHSEHDLTAFAAREQVWNSTPRPFRYSSN